MPRTLCENQHNSLHLNSSFNPFFLRFIMSGPGGFSIAFSSNGKYDSTRGASIGRNDNSVATAKDGSDFSSFLGPLPPFSGRQRADEAFSRETWGELRS